MKRSKKDWEIWWTTEGEYGLYVCDSSFTRKGAISNAEQTSGKPWALSMRQ